MSNFVTIATYNSSISAHLHVAILAANDIKAFLKDDNVISIDPLLSPALGGIKLQVMEQDVIPALAILNTDE